MVIEHFKSIDDAHDHIAGDATLQAVARCFNDRIDGDVMGSRHGGQRLSARPRSGTANERRNFAVGVGSAIGEFDFCMVGDRFAPTGSAGITLARNSSLVRRLAQADAAMYGAEAQGRNRVEVWTP